MMTVRRDAQLGEERSDGALGEGGVYENSERLLGRRRERNKARCETGKESLEESRYSGQDVDLSCDSNNGDPSTRARRNFVSVANAESTETGRDPESRRRTAPREQTGHQLPWGIRPF